MRFKLRDRIRVKRAVLKSPVREIRTQGSVRGQLGNWLFYLDCFLVIDNNAYYFALQKYVVRYSLAQSNQRRILHRVESVY